MRTATLQVGRTTLLSAGVTASKPHHHLSRETFPALVFSLGGRESSLASFLPILARFIGRGMTSGLRTSEEARDRRLSKALGSPTARSIWPTEQHQSGAATQHRGTLPSREQRGAASVLRPASPPAEDRIASAPLVAAAAGSLERRQAQGPTLGRPAVQTVQEFLMDSAEPSIAENHHDVTAFRVAHHMRNNRVHVG